MSAAGTLHASRQNIHTLETTATKSLLEGITASHLRLLALVRSSDIQDAQWQVGAPTPLPAEDTNIRGKGMVSDSTANVAYDGRRLRLRAAVIEAESAMILASQAMSRAEDRLRKALDRHQGLESLDEIAESAAGTNVTTTSFGGAVYTSSSDE